MSQPLQIVSLKCTCENEIIATFNTNCPKDTLINISGIVQDACIDLSEGAEVAKFQSIVESLGYDCIHINAKIIIDI
jgi:hypothetical protein